MDNNYAPVIEIEHPEMLIGMPQRDSRLDAVSDCEYTGNNETYD